MRILIVDDSPLVWQRVFEMLRELSFISLLAYTPRVAEARQCLAGIGVDLVVLDVALPDGSGLELLQEIRGSSLAPPVALFTNRVELRAKGLALGARWFFDKSLDFSAFLALLNDRPYWLALIQQHRGQANAEV